MAETASEVDIFPDREALYVAATAMIADATGYHFDFVGKEPYDEPEEEAEIQEVRFPFPSEPWTKVMYLTIVRMQLAGILIPMISETVEEAEGLARPLDGDLSWLTEGLKLSERALERLGIDQESTPVSTTPKVKAHILENALWVIDLFDDEDRTNELWTLCKLLESHQTVHDWTLRFIRRASEVAPDKFRSLDWHQAELRSAIERRIREIVD